MRFKISQILLPASLILSVLFNLILAYFLIDNAVTYTYTEISFHSVEREKKDALLVINALIPYLSESEFHQTLKLVAQKNPDMFLKPENNAIDIGSLTFTKINGHYNAGFMNDSPEDNSKHQ